MESSGLPGGKERINPVPAVETDQKAVVLEHAVHLRDRGHQPLVRFVIGDRSAIAGGVADQVRGVGGDKVHTSRWHLPHHLHAVTWNNPIDELIDTIHKPLLYILFTILPQAVCLLPST